MDGAGVTDEPLMRVPEAQRMLNVSRGWLYEAAKSGRIPHVRLGGPDGPLRFVRSDLEEYIDDARRGWRPNAATLSRLN
jgi:excisionase family DNA binding protein